MMAKLWAVLISPLIVSGSRTAVALAGVAAGDPPSANDVFAGRIEHGTGADRTAQGTVRIVISLGEATLGSRPLTLRFEGTPCAPGETACVVLDGVVHGRATPQRSVPDAGELLRLTGAPRSAPSGRSVSRAPFTAQASSSAVAR
jgi:hypothetical protein